jgi:hypothetical protein
MHCGAENGQGNMKIPNTDITLEELLDKKYLWTSNTSTRTDFYGT